MSLDVFVNKILFTEPEYDIIQNRITALLKNNPLQIPMIVQEYINLYVDARHRSIIIGKVNDTLKYMLDKNLINIDNNLWITLNR